ncbi:hypothetical protein GCM10009801_10160 [Streptomyces albiaxialis]|uniref:SUKH-3 domain containing protein n=1 Tax=Streptomyces albiaxialis TaxID=329523 RepID=A0ABP5H532_9ACTN
MTDFPRSAHAELARAGWHPGRRAPLEGIRPELAMEGHSLTRAAEEFLAEYAGLRMKVRDPASGAAADSFDFDAVGASSIPAHNVRRYEAALGESLTPVGSAFGEVMTLLVSGSGAMYAVLDATLLHVGDDAAEAITVLCGNGELREVGGVNWD